MADHFDIVNDWSNLSDEELTQIVSNEAIETLQRVTRLLEDERVPDREIVTTENFVSMVRKMSRLYHDGSWQLTKAIIEGSNFADNHEFAKAKDVYEQFLDSCGSKFYRDIARNRLKKLPTQK